MSRKAATPIRQEREHRVAILAFDRPSLFELSVSIEVWGNDRKALGVPFSEVRVCSDAGPLLQTTSGFAMSVDHGLEALEWADTIVIPNGQISDAAM